MLPGQSRQHRPRKSAGKGLAGGVNLIDASANYAEGASEELVGEVLGSLIDSGRLLRDAVILVSKAVSTAYEAAAAEQARQIREAVVSVAPDWGGEARLSRLAIRALRSTAGVGSVLVGMRRECYVDDVSEELRKPVAVRERLFSWQRLQAQIRAMDFESETD